MERKRRGVADSCTELASNEDTEVKTGGERVLGIRYLRIPKPHTGGPIYTRAGGESVLGGIPFILTPCLSTFLSFLTTVSAT